MEGPVPKPLALLGPSGVTCESFTSPIQHVAFHRTPGWCTRHGMAKPPRMMYCPFVAPLWTQTPVYDETSIRSLSKLELSAMTIKGYAIRPSCRVVHIPSPYKSQLYMTGTGDCLYVQDDSWGVLLIVSINIKSILGSSRAWEVTSES